MFESTQIENLGALADKADERAADPAMYPSMRESLIRRATRLRSAQCEIIADVLNPKPYPFQNVMRGPSRGFLVSCAVVAGISFASLALIVLVIL